MQGLNSLLNVNPSQMSLQDLQNGGHPPNVQNFEPSHDDFLEQMFSNLPSWPDITPQKSTWDLDDSTPSNSDNVPFHFDESALLASKLRQQQISGNSKSAAAMLFQQQLMRAAGAGISMSPVSGSGDSGLLPLPLSLGSTDPVDRSQNGVVDACTFKSPNPGVEGSVQALYNGYAGSLQGTGQSSNHFQAPQGGSMGAQNFGAPAAVLNQSQTAGGGAGQPRQRVRARRGQATDPHSIAERLRRERIAERMKALQELVPNANKTDKASMLDEIIDYVKFLQLQVKVLSMSRLGGAAAVAPLVTDMSSSEGGDCVNGGMGRSSNGTQTASSNDSMTITEHQVAKLMEEDMGSAMQYLQGKGLCLMPISLATAISTATCHSRNQLTAAATATANNHRRHPLLPSNGEGPSSPSMSVLTVQSATMGSAGIDGSVKDAASVSKP